MNEPSKLIWTIQQNGESGSVINISILTPMYVKIITLSLIIVCLIASSSCLDKIANMNFAYASFWDKLYYVGGFFQCLFFPYDDYCSRVQSSGNKILCITFCVI